MSPQDNQIYEKQYELQAPDEPRIRIRTRTQIIVHGQVRYMGESFELPLREGLGFVGQGESEQVIDEKAPLTWTGNAPGPQEAQQGRAAGAQGSRESQGPGQSQPGGQQERQGEAYQQTSEHEAQQPLNKSGKGSK